MLFKLCRSLHFGTVILQKMCLRTSKSLLFTIITSKNHPVGKLSKSYVYNSIFRIFYVDVWNVWVQRWLVTFFLRIVAAALWSYPVF